MGPLQCPLPLQTSEPSKDLQIADGKKIIITVENINSQSCFLHVQGLLFLWPLHHPHQHGLVCKSVEGRGSGHICPSFSNIILISDVLLCGPLKYLQTYQEICPIAALST